MRNFIDEHPIIAFLVASGIYKTIKDILYTARFVTSDCNYATSYKEYIRSTGDIDNPPKRYYERGKGKENEDAELDKNEQMEREENEVDAGSEVSDDGNGESE